MLILIGHPAFADSGFVSDNPSTWNWPFPFVLSGDENIENETCVILSDDRNRRTEIYRVRVSDEDSNGYVLEQRSPNTTGRLPIELSWYDPGNGYFLLEDNKEEKTKFEGNLAGNCRRVSALRISISQSDYLSVPAGNYYDSFELRVNGKQDVFSTFNIDVDVPEFVRVSFPNGDISIPFSNNVDQLVVEQFCIYTNALNRSVGVAVSVLNNDDDGNHSVLDSGFAQINYSFDFRTAGGGTTLGSINTEDGMVEVATANADNQSSICAVSGNTHEFAVSVTAADMAAATVGNYSDTITVFVEPAL